jgi:aryl-alcohol dehydrogenase-like predicted oxidoreductase
VLFRDLGNTGMRVSILGLGAASLGSVYGPVDADTAVATVHRALDVGINFFDASPYYGATKGESMLGRGLRGVPRQDYFVATKCGRNGQDDFDFSPVALERSLDASLQRLGVDAVDVLQLHDVEFGDLDRILEESLPALQRLQAAGKARHVGMTGLPLQVFARALAKGAALDTVLSYCHFTLFDQTLAELLPALQARGIGVVNASPLAMGLLSRHGPRDWHPAPPLMQETCRRAEAFCRARSVDLARLAIQFSCSHPGIATTLCGTADPEEIAANAAALEQPPDPHLLREVRAVLAPIHNRTWLQGRPENNA